jgi:hypothetical protein
LEANFIQSNMGFEPQKFFIGVIDFFSILLPGALLTFLFKNQLGPYILGAAYSQLSGSEGPAAFLFRLVGPLFHPTSTEGAPSLRSLQGWEFRWRPPGDFDFLAPARRPRDRRDVLYFSQTAPFPLLLHPPVS